MNRRASKETFKINWIIAEMIFNLKELTEDIVFLKMMSK